MEYFNLSSSSVLKKIIIRETPWCILPHYQTPCPFCSEDVTSLLTLLSLGKKLSSLSHTSDKSGKLCVRASPFFLSINRTHTLMFSFSSRAMVPPWKELRGGGESSCSCVSSFYTGWLLIFSLCSVPAFRVLPCCCCCCCRLLFWALMCKEWISVQCDLRGPGRWWWPPRQSGL